MELYRDNGEENGNYYSIIGFGVLKGCHSITSYLAQGSLPKPWRPCSKVRFFGPTQPGSCLEGPGGLRKYPIP